MRENLLKSHNSPVPVYVCIMSSCYYVLLKKINNMQYEPNIKFNEIHSLLLDVKTNFRPDSTISNNDLHQPLLKYIQWRPYCHDFALNAIIKIVF